MEDVASDGRCLSPMIPPRTGTPTPSILRMDTISIIGPTTQPRQMNQEEFDSRFNFFTSKGEKLSRRVWLKNKIRQQWECHTQRGDRISRPADFLPFLKWIRKYGLKTDLPRDICGSLLLAALFLPQGIASGVLSVGNACVGIYSLIIPQLIYPLLGSSQHSSLGSLSFVCLFVRSSVEYNKTDTGTLALFSAIFHLLLAVLPLESLVGWVPDSLLSGFCSALILRLVFYFLSNAFAFDDPKCDSLLTEMSVRDCLWANVWPIGFSCVVLLSLCLIHYLVHYRFVSSLPITPPYQFLLLLLSMLLSYLCDLDERGIRLLGMERSYSTISTTLPKLSPIMSSIFDALSIALFAIAIHLKISKSVAVEKMHVINRKQELMAFSSFEAPLAFLGLFPVSSAHGKAQLNVESARFSLVSNIIAMVWISLFVVFMSDILKYIPMCVIACIVVTSFPGVVGDIKGFVKISKYSRSDMTTWLISACLALLIPNVCSAFLFAVLFSLLTIVCRIQWPSNDILIRLSSEGYYGEEAFYDVEQCESPAKVYRFNAPLIFANVDIFRNEVSKHAKTIKGQLAMGLGTRTASLRSQLEPKDSIVRSRNNLANIIIYQEASTPPNPVDGALIRVLIIDCSAITHIDVQGIEAFTDVFFELQEQSIRVLYAASNVRVRNALAASDFYSRVSRQNFFPTVLDAHLSARALLHYTIHTSVSMNGCRDVIALSTATSNHEELGAGCAPEAPV